jgi:hypothetical protein
MINFHKFITRPKLIKVKGHSNIIKNDEVDKLA